MIDIRDQILDFLKEKGVVSFHEICSHFPKQSMVHVAELLGSMVEEGLFRKRIDPRDNTTYYYMRYFTGSGELIVFHYRDHSSSETLEKLPFIEEQPWLFEPVDFEGDEPYSGNYGTFHRALKMAEYREAHPEMDEEAEEGGTEDER